MQTENQIRALVDLFWQWIVFVSYVINVQVNANKAKVEESRIVDDSQKSYRAVVDQAESQSSVWWTRIVDAGGVEV